MQLEGLRRGDLALREQVVELAQALLERAAEPLLLGDDPLEDVLALGLELGVGLAHRLDDRVDVARQERVLHPGAVPLLDRAAHDAAQDVAAVLVGGHDAVGDEERHAARVVGEDPQRALVDLAGGQLAPEAP